MDTSGSAAPPSAVGISASPDGAHSRSRRLLDRALERFEFLGIPTHRVDLAALPADALLGRRPDDDVAWALDRVTSADLIVVATPIYRAAYSGLLKVFLDLLPDAAFNGKVAIPIASGGSAGHLLAIDHAVRPLLASLGAVVTSTGVYGTPERFGNGANARSGAGAPDAALLGRLDRAVREAIALATGARPSPVVLPTPLHAERIA